MGYPNRGGGVEFRPPLPPPSVSWFSITPAGIRLRAPILFIGLDSPSLFQLQRGASRRFMYLCSHLVFYFFWCLPKSIYNAWAAFTHSNQILKLEVNLIKGFCSENKKKHIVGLGKHIIGFRRYNKAAQAYI